jgi:hypothetical protein
MCSGRQPVEGVGWQLATRHEVSNVLKSDAGGWQTCSYGYLMAVTARLSRPLTESSDAAASRARDRSSSHGISARTAASMSAFVRRCGGISEPVHRS